MIRPSITHTIVDSREKAIPVAREFFETSVSKHPMMVCALDAELRPAFFFSGADLSAVARDVTQKFLEEGIKDCFIAVHLGHADGGRTPAPDRFEQILDALGFAVEDTIVFNADGTVRA